MKIDRRFTQQSGLETFTGNELLVKGALEVEGGVHLLTGYPGSPVAGFFDTLETVSPLLSDKGIVARIANNEALSLAMVNGAQMAGCRAITAFKSVGLHVASDALALGVLAGTQGESGGLIVCGDDPWSDSTQVPADSRYLAEHVRLPMIEPCSPQEVKDWVNLAFKLGRAGQIYIGYTMTVLTADGGGTVQCYPNHYPSVNEKLKRSLSYERDIAPNLEQSVLLPPRTWRREMGLEQRFAAVKAEARRLGINRILHRPAKGDSAPLGFIAAGCGYAFLSHALAELGLAGRIPILKLGLTYPVDEQIVVEFARLCGQVVVVEERRGFVERQVLEAIAPLRQAGEAIAEVYGKQFPKALGVPGLPSTRGLTPSVLIERLIPLLRAHPALPVEGTAARLNAEAERIAQTAAIEVQIPDRTPSFCPGCPHRDSSSVLLELRRDLLDPQYMLQRHKRKPVDLVAHGDTGCYTMLMYEPNKPLMHNYSGMGLGGGTGSGADPFIDNKQIVFMGDGTFFHSGQVAVSHSIKSGQDIAYIILDNKTTAMTGHQSHPGVEYDVMGRPTFAQDIERIVTAMIPKALAKDVRVVRIDPSDRDRYRKLLEQTILADGVKVVIADKECGITLHRRARAEERQQSKALGYLPRKTHMNVATEVCEFCLECTMQTGCPGLKISDTDYGPKVQTDFSTCVNDGACQRINACPSFEEVTVLRRQAPRNPDEHVDLTDLPDAPRPIHADQDTWRCLLTGVGGMGIGLCTAILVTAGHEMGYHVQFFDKKGLAIRNGGVTSQLVYTRARARQATVDPAFEMTTPLIPYGKADLLLGVDILEAVRAVDPKHPQRVVGRDRTAMVVNSAKTPTILALMGREDFAVPDLERLLERTAKPGQYLGFNVGDLCERVLDSKLYANIMMLGIAYQKGFLPLKLEAIENAIRTVVRNETERNLRAFAIGRRIVLRPDLFVVEPTHEVESARKAVRRKSNTLRVQHGSGKRGKLAAKQFRVLLKKTWRATQGLRVDDALMRDVVIRAYDCLLWGGMDYAKRYCERLVAFFKKDDPAQGYRATRVVVWNLAKAMLIKDEVYVAAQLTNPEKLKRDRRRFNVIPERGDRILYKHYNRPEFDFMGLHVRFEWKSRDWQLRLMARMGFLRSLMPRWHRREREFRDWYETLVDRFDWTPEKGPRDYQRWLAILGVPEPVTGFREVRYPKMEAAKLRAEQLLAMDPELFEPNAGPALPPAAPTNGQPAPGAPGNIPLPILTGAGT
ncbi:MAG: thiamine pyrophosphate-dependent enzyme [Planctomycetota bacterium]|nr:thiamine pyrophosphate-dependent enzyme [Planctomycetota bacterium]